MSKEKYVVILGASFVNSGAESMTNIVVTEVKKQFPNCRIVLGTTDKKVQKDIDAEIISYQFPTENKWDNAFMSFFFRYKLGGIPDKSDRFYKIIKNTIAIIDISGYAFTTKFGVSSVYSYLHRIYMAKKLNIPFYILPQSFGPIECDDWCERLLLNMLIKYYFKYPEIICARECSGYRFMLKYGLKKLYFLPDIVLLYPKEIKSMKTDNASKVQCLEPGSTKKVAIVPNQKIFEKTKHGNQYMELLRYYIDYLIENGFEIHIIEHCGLDALLCKKLYSAYQNEKAVFYHGEFLDSETYLEIVENMEFIIASRYHAIVHGYRKYIPAIALGWEDKYNELLALMDQKEYCIDCREDIDITGSMVILQNMVDTCELQKEKINQRLGKVRRKYGEYPMHSR